MKRKTALSLALTSALVFSTTPVLADNISDLKSQVETKQSKKSELNTELTTVNKDMQSLEDKITSLNTKISDNLTAISTVEGKIQKTQEEMSQTEENIHKAEKELESKKGILSQNLRVMYSKGKVSYIEFLFRSDSMSDFLYRFNTLEDIANANKKLYQEIKDILSTLNAQKETLEKQKTDLTKQKDELTSLKSTLEAQQSDQLDAMQKLEAQQYHINNEIDEQNSAIDSINAEIASLIEKREEERRQQAALQAQELAKQEQAKQAQQTTQHSTNQLSNSGSTSKGTTTTPTAPISQAGNGMFSLPIKQGSYYISSPYGWRTHPVTGVKKYHSGIDYASALGTPIYAIGDGVVLYAGTAQGYGHWIVIDHQNGLYSIYGHMYASGLYVKPGQVVKKGQNIGAVGSDGMSTGAHLHLSLSKGMNGGSFNYVNPADYY